MIKVKEFFNEERIDIDDKINSFIERNDIDIIDIKYTSWLDTINDVIMSSALLIYREREEDMVHLKDLIRKTIEKNDESEGE